MKYAPSVALAASVAGSKVLRGFLTDACQERAQGRRGGRREEIAWVVCPARCALGQRILTSWRGQFRNKCRILCREKLLPVLFAGDVLRRACSSGLLQDCV